MRAFLNRVFVWLSALSCGRLLLRVLGWIRLEIPVRRTVYFLESLRPNETLRASGRFFSEHAHEVETVKGRLADDRSCRVYDAAVLFRTTSRQRALLKSRSAREDQYFEPGLFPVASRECFVDCGAFDGDTMMSFFRNYRKDHTYYALEFNPFNVRKLERTVADEQAPDVEILQCGI